MAFIDYDLQKEELTRTQRWGHYLTIGIAIVLVLFALNQRNSAVSATTVYENPVAGFRLQYPSNWLLDEDGSDYIFQVRDMINIGFKTTFQIDIETINDQTSPWNVLTARAILRSLSLALYDTLFIEETTLPNDTVATQMDYVFAFTEANPILESIPTIVLGRDILIVRGNQALIITFRSDVNTFQENLAIFNQFLNNIEFQ